MYQTIKACDRLIPRAGRRLVFPDRLIAAMYLWSVMHDRPLCWACERTNYTSCFRPRRLPSVSQFCRRVQTPRIQQLLNATHARVAEAQRSSAVCYVDGRPLPVGACSKDRDAKRGKISGGFARGYKLHALVTEDRRVPVWSVTALNVSEQSVAEQLIETIPEGVALNLLLGDSNYDSGPLYDKVAARGGRLVTPLPKNAGQGHRRQSPARLEAVAAWRGMAGYVYKDRWEVERCFGAQASLGGGIAPLPAWVRTLPRVRRWIGAKLIVYHARLQRQRAVS
jgi:hypothetical protein